MKAPQASVIIAFYNKINFLKLVMAGFERQTYKDFEIVIADDGSRQEVVKELQELIHNSALTISHIWHEDRGWRKNEMLNKAVQSSRTDYLIFIDGDCIPHSRFVEEHVLNSKEGILLTGRRVNLSEKLSGMLTPENVGQGFLEKKLFTIWKDVYLGKSNNMGQGIHLKNLLLRRLVNLKKRGILGSNFSVFKADLLKINGFDERYQAPAIGEDSDIQYRMELCGMQTQSLIHIAIQYHLYHKELPRESRNTELFAQVKREQKPYTPYGIRKISV